MIVAYVRMHCAYAEGAPSIVTDRRLNQCLGNKFDRGIAAELDHASNLNQS